MRRRLGLVASYRILKPLAERYGRGDVVLTSHEVATILRKWAGLYERTDLHAQANALREASVWFDTADYDPTPDEPNRITFREMAKQFREIRARTQ